jgi:hypothetical protein
MTLNTTTAGLAARLTLRGSAIEHCVLVIARHGQLADPIVINVDMASAAQQAAAALCNDSIDPVNDCRVHGTVAEFRFDKHCAVVRMNEGDGWHGRSLRQA